MKRGFKSFLAVVFAFCLCFCCYAQGEETEPDTEVFQVDREQLEFICGFCRDYFPSESSYSESFIEEYGLALENAERLLEDYSQEQAEEAYWDLYLELNKACLYTETAGDFDGDSVCDVNDCTRLQKCIAGLEEPSLYQLYKLGFQDGVAADISTVTEIQKSMAKLTVFENSESFEELKNRMDEKDITANGIFYNAYLENGMEDDKPQSNGIKVYLSPSNQNENIYAWGGTNEMIQCNLIAQAAEKYLLEHGFEIMRAPQGQDTYATIDQSNSWEADLHIPIHTNALDGTLTGGTMIMIYDFNDPENTKVARNILDSLAALTPGPDYGVMLRKDLNELSDINAMSVYVECEYHDTEEGAKFIIENTDPLGEAIAKGVCLYYGIEW